MKLCFMLTFLRKPYKKHFLKVKLHIKGGGSEPIRQMAQTFFFIKGFPYLKCNEEWRWIKISLTFNDCSDALHSVLFVGQGDTKWQRTLQRYKNKSHFYWEGQSLFLYTVEVTRLSSMNIYNRLLEDKATPTPRCTTKVLVSC